MQLTGRTTFELIDEEGDESGSWEFEWVGRDPFELIIAAVTEVSGRPWKWSTKRSNSGKLSPQLCRVLSVRVGRVLRKENRGRTAACIARVVAEEYSPRRKQQIDPKAVRVLLAKINPDMPEDADERPELLAAVMLRRFRRALKAAVEGDVGLRISWLVE